MKKLFILLGAYLTLFPSMRADIVASENFGTLTDGTAITTGNISLNYARASTGVGSFIYATNDASSGFSGASADLYSSSGSLTGIGMSNLTAFTVGTLNVSVYAPSTSSLSGLYFFLGTGPTFVGNSAFSGNDLTAGFNFSAGNLQTRNSANAWATIGTDTFSGDNVYNLSFVFNDSASTVNYNGYSVAAGTADIWLNGSLYGDDVSIRGAQSTTAFRIYTTSSSSPFEIDDISLVNSAVAPIPEPSVIALAAFGGIAFLLAARKKS